MTTSQSWPAPEHQAQHRPSTGPAQAGKLPIKRGPGAQDRMDCDTDRSAPQILPHPHTPHLGTATGAEGAEENLNLQASTS